MSKADTTTRFTQVGWVTSAIGIHGEVSLRLRAGASLANVSGIELWLVPPPLRGRVGVVEHIEEVSTEPAPGPDRGSNPARKVRLSNIADRRAAQEAAGRELFALTSELPEALLSRLAENPDEGGAATDDAVGLRVVSTTHGVLGEVVEVLETGANQVWVVRGTDWGEVLLPVIDDVVLQINQEKRLAQVAVLPGLIEDSDGSGDA